MEISGLDQPQKGGRLLSLTHEQHYTPVELGEVWNLSPAMVRKLFQNEPGVMRIGEPSRRVGRKLKRSYFSLRIPHSVADRVHQRLRNVS
jgi:hypothetical protein